MSILIDKSSRVVTQGITGSTGRYHTRACVDYGYGEQAFVAGVTPGKGGTMCDKIPVFNTVSEARKETGCNVSVVYVPPAHAAGAIDEAVDAGIELIICITEGVPLKDMLLTRHRMLGKATVLVGPNCPGIITPDQLKIAIIHGYIHQKGSIGVVSRSGTLTYEVVHQLSQQNLGQSTCVGIGGDPINGLKHLDVMRLFNEDPDTEAVVLCGEIGGSDEEDCAVWMKDHMSKPVVGFIAGSSAPPGKRMGHAGAIVAGGKGTAEEKMAALEDAGVFLARNPAEIGSTMKQALMR